ncbi:hypothetical protein CRUP_024080 [Coryphaenoides rupestris]|nr:hypothetical protein CRUP_024080 [Coryphaenoides rupestris]
MTSFSSSSATSTTPPPWWRWARATRLGSPAGPGGPSTSRRWRASAAAVTSRRWASTTWPTASPNEGTLKLEADNNHLNHRQQQPQLGASVPAGGGGGLYIIQPQAPGPRWNTDESHRPSLVPVYPDALDYNSGGVGGGGGGGGSPAPPAYHQSEPARGWEPLGAADADDEDEDDEGVGGTPDYTGDESESVLSVDIHTSTTSVSSTDTRDGGLRWPPAKTPDASTAESGISVMKSEDEEEEQEERQTRRTEEGGEDVRSVTDSMVAEALAALEDATAGEDFE